MTASPLKFALALAAASVALLPGGVLPSAFASSAPAPAPNPVEVVHLWTGWKASAAFDRLGEFFRGLDRSRESPLLITRADSRDGYFFSLRLRTPTAHPGSTVELAVVTPTVSKAKTHTFKTDIPAGTRTYNIGLTGEDWPDEAAHPVAWQLTVRNAQGRVLAQRQSFLWK